MKIIVIDDEGNVETIECRKIEFSVRKFGKLIVDDGDYVIDAQDVMKVVC